VPVNLQLLDTPTWRTFVAARGLKTGKATEQLQRIGLADTVGGELLPTRAAVLLFADAPGSLLAAHGSRADIRLMVYSGKTAATEALPNLRKTPLSIRGPLIVQIDDAVKAVLRELEEGLVLASSGFNLKTQLTALWRSESYAEYDFFGFFERHQMGAKRYAPDCTFFDSPCFVVSALQRITIPPRHAHI